MTIEDLLERFPAANEYLIERGLPCLVCGEPFWGTLGEFARRRGMDNVEELVRGLNDYLGLDADEETTGEENT